MNTKFIYSVLLIVSFLLIFSPCPSDDNGSTDNSLEFARIESSVLTGNWRNTVYVDYGQNKTNDFENLNDDWDITSHSATTLNLIHISGGNGETDTLVFTTKL